jgi:hypothetical protein
LRKAQLASARKRRGKKSSSRKKTFKRVGKSIAKGAVGTGLILGSMNTSVSLAAGRGARYSASAGMAGFKTGAKIGTGIVAVAYGVGAIQRRRKKRK